MLITEPTAIEKRSMEIIESEHKTALSAETKDIVKRVIHCTADFDYAENLKFSDGVVEKARKALAAGCDIITDTQMAKAGINKAAAAKLGCGIYCFMSDPDVAEKAKERGVTRAAAAVEKAAGMGDGALIAISELVASGGLRPAAVIGVPVGFVNVIESKQALTGCGADYIVSLGRKGGSNVAASIVNALMYGITR